MSVLGEEGNMSVQTPFKVWRGATVNPMGSALALGLMTGIPAYYLTPHIMRTMLRVGGPMIPDKARADIEKEMNEEGGRTARNVALAVGGTTAALSLAHNYDPDNPVKGYMTWNR